MEYQRVWAEINLDNIAHNIKTLKTYLAKDVEIMAVIKADGYGHGAVEVSKVLLYNGASSLGVAICDEGVSLRQNNIFVPILILGYTPAQKLSDVVTYNLIQTVFSKEAAQELSEVAVRLNRQAEIHIKIDTGMGRLGFVPNVESAEVIAEIAKLPNILISGIYTHFAEADKKQSNFTNEQYEKFQFILNELKNRGLTFKTVHASNSAASILYKNMGLNVVRAGIVLYGLKPSDDFENTLKPAMSFKTQISYIKTVPQNTSIGYGRTYYTKEETTVATIPVGYADGYSRLLSNCGKVLIRGQFAPIIGNICMDQFMVDVSHIKSVKAGDEVVLFGKQGKNEIPADEIAKTLNTINYEIVCSVGKRVPRVYIKGGKIIMCIYLNSQGII